MLSPSRLLALDIKVYFSSESELLPMMPWLWGWVTSHVVEITEDSRVEDKLTRGQRYTGEPLAGAVVWSEIVILAHTHTHIPTLTSEKAFSFYNANSQLNRKWWEMCWKWEKGEFYTPVRVGRRCERARERVHTHTHTHRLVWTKSEVRLVHSRRWGDRSAGEEDEAEEVITGKGDVSIRWQTHEWGVNL